ncbi:MAG TPA: hypothetical protein VEO01_13530, partial [Pseudonocardiaceae bacterium]|nr:hypothetical protein [Pseudonocardiaceae bacterium]
ETITIGDMAGQLYIGMLVRFAAQQDLFQLVYSVWNRNNIVFQRPAAMNVDSVNCVWLGTDSASAAFSCVDTTIVNYNIASESISRPPVQGQFTSLSVSATSAPAAAPRIFAVLASDNGVHEFLPGPHGQPGNWSQALNMDGAFRQVLATLDGGNATHLFAVSADNGLFHWQPDTTSPIGFDDGTTIARTVASASTPMIGADTVHLCAVGTAQATLSLLYRESLSTNWVRRDVEVPKGGQLEEYVAYTSDVAVYDAQDALLVNTPVTISVSEVTRMTVNGGVYTVTPDRPVRTSTNAAGLLSIAQETSDLAIPLIGVNVTNLMPADQTITLDQSAGVHQRLAEVDGAELMDATKADGSYLLADQYRTRESTDNLASALNRCMALHDGSSLARVQSLPGRARSNQGVGLLHKGSVRDLPLLVSQRGYTPWRLTFRADGVVFEDLDPAQAQRLVAQRAEHLPSANGLFDWLEDIGDFLSGVVDGVIDVVDTVLTLVGDTVKAVVDCVIDGINYVYDAVVDTLEAVFDLVEVVFAKVLVFFEQIFQWLGFLFSWNDILRTHQATVYSVQQFLGFVSGTVDGVQRLLDQGINTVQSRIDSAFDQAVAEIAGDSSLGGYAQANRPASPELDSALANTVVLNALIDNVAGAAPASRRGLRQDDAQQSGLDDVMAQLQQLATDISQTSAFSDARNWFTTLGSGRDQIFNQLLSEFLRICQQLVKA